MSWFQNIVQYVHLFLLKNLLYKDTFIITKGSGDTPIFVNMTIFITLYFLLVNIFRRNLMKPPEIWWNPSFIRFHLNKRFTNKKYSVYVFKNLPFPRVATKKRKKNPKAISNSRTPFSKGCHQQKNRREKIQSNLKFQNSLFQGCHQKNIRREKAQSNHKCQDSLFQGLPPFSKGFLSH